MLRRIVFTLHHWKAKEGFKAWKWHGQTCVLENSHWLPQSRLGKDGVGRTLLGIFRWKIMVLGPLQGQWVKRDHMHLKVPRSRIHGPSRMIFFVANTLWALTHAALLNVHHHLMHIEKGRTKSYISSLSNCVEMVLFVGTWGHWKTSRFGRMLKSVWVVQCLRCPCNIHTEMSHEGLEDHSGMPQRALEWRRWHESCQHLSGWSPKLKE